MAGLGSFFYGIYDSWTKAAVETQKRRQQADRDAELQHTANLTKQEAINAQVKFEENEKRKQLAWEAARERSRKEWIEQQKRTAEEKEASQKSKYCEQLQKLRGPLNAVTKHLSAVKENSHDKTNREQLVKAVESLVDQIDSFVNMSDMKIFDIIEIREIESNLVALRLQLKERQEQHRLDFPDSVNIAKAALRILSTIESFIVLIENRNSGSFESADEFLSKRKKNLDRFLEHLWSCQHIQSMDEIDLENEEEPSSGCVVVPERVRSISIYQPEVENETRHHRSRCDSIK